MIGLLFSLLLLVLYFHGMGTARRQVNDLRFKLEKAMKLADAYHGLLTDMQVAAETHIRLLRDSWTNNVEQLLRASTRRADEITFRMKKTGDDEGYITFEGPAGSVKVAASRFDEDPAGSLTWIVPQVLGEPK